MKLAALLVLAPALTLAQSLTGVIDLHAHADPDGSARSIDAIDLAKLAKSRGMRGLVIKNHYEPTAAVAYLVRKEVPGIEVFGGISLDLTVGGVNPAAVEWMTKVKGGYGKIVWMPTFDSEHQVTTSGDKRPFASVAKNGKLLPETEQVLSVIARNKLVLATGHSSPTEALLLIREAKKQGIAGVIVTHATNNFVGMSVPQMQEAAQMGAFLEFVWVRPGSAAMREAAANIRAVGPAQIILSSDLGQANNPLHPDGLLSFYQELMKLGITEAEINQMAKTNPAKLLGL